MTKIKIILIISLVGLGVMTWWYTRQREMIVFCDVGQGDGAVVINNNFQMIIDAGPDNGKMAECLSKYLPFWDKEIEGAIISHWDGDHAGGLRRLQQLYRINKVYSGIPPSGDFEQINYSGNLVSGDILGSEELQFEVKLPLAEKEVENSDGNENSLVGLLQYGIKKILFAGDITAEEEGRMVWRKILEQETGSGKPETRILKVSHHGSKEATSEDLLEAWKPDAAVISVGEKNKFGHPAKEVLERLEKFGVEVWRTDQKGDIVVEL